MRVQGIQSFQVNPYHQNQLTPKSGSGQIGKFRDELLISQEAKMMQGVDGLEKERAKRVAQITEQVQTGQYKPNPEEIASSMLQFYRGYS